MVLLLAFLFFWKHDKVETVYYTWYPGNSYDDQYIESFPARDVGGEPRIVLVRKVGNIDCTAVYYSNELEVLLEKASSRQVKVTYRVTMKFGRTSWIETLDTQGIPNLMGNTGQRGRGDCF